MQYNQWQLLARPSLRYWTWGLSWRQRLVTPEALPALERMDRLSKPVLRSLTVRFEKADQLTGFTRVPDDDGREEDRDDRRRGGRRGESCHRRGDGHSPRRGPDEDRRTDHGARACETSVTRAAEDMDDESA